MQFGEWLKHHRKQLRLTQRDLAERTGISFSYISTLEREQPHSITGKSIQPKRDVVESLARAVNGNVEEALHAAGYATTTPTKPQTLPELVAALESLGIETPLMYDDLPTDDDGEAFREVVERIWLDVELVTKRLASRREAVIERERIAADLRGEVVARIEPAKKAA